MPKRPASVDRVSLKPYRRRLASLLFGTLFVMMAVLGINVIYISNDLGPRLTELADRQQSAQAIIPARRGMILDRHGRVLASTMMRPTVFVDPMLVADPRELSETLARNLSLDPNELFETLSNAKVANKRYVVIARHLEPVDAEAIVAMKDTAVGIVHEPVRYYPLGGDAAHVTGFVDRDGIGQEGAEQRFNPLLAGQPGIRATVRDVRRKVLWRSESGSVPSMDGGHVQLTIDAEIQRIAAKAVRRGVEDFKAESGVAIVMNPTTGEVLAMACWPTFDPSKPGDSPSANRRNRAIVDPVEPGSTFKPFTASGALAGGYVNTTEQIDCRMGQHHFGRRTVKDVKRLGVADLKDIITHSSNIGMSFVVSRMDRAFLHKTIRAFGFGETTGIELPGEAAGVVYPVKKWSGLSQISLAMGYEVLTTPLQIVNAFSAIVNDGVLLRPTMLLAELNADGSVAFEQTLARPVHRVLPAHVADWFRTVALPSVVEHGSGRKIELDGHTALGKTGTTKLTDESGTYAQREYQCAFLAAAPVEDPQVAVLVMIRRPDANKGSLASLVAVPYAGEILRGTLRYMGVPASAEVVEADGQVATR